MLRARVTPLHHNLLDPIPSQVDGCQVVFCRNVLIYFSPEHARAFLDRLADALPEATLFLGAAESIWQLSDRYDTVRTGDTFSYRRRARATPADDYRSGHRSAAQHRCGQPRPDALTGRGPRRSGTPAARPTSREPARGTGRRAAERRRDRRPTPAMPRPSPWPASGPLRAGDAAAAVVAFRKCAYLAPDDPWPTCTSASPWKRPATEHPPSGPTLPPATPAPHCGARRAGHRGLHHRGSAALHRLQTTGSATHDDDGLLHFGRERRYCMPVESTRGVRRSTGMVTLPAPEPTLPASSPATRRSPSLRARDRRRPRSVLEAGADNLRALVDAVTGLRRIADADIGPPPEGQDLPLISGTIAHRRSPRPGRRPRRAGRHGYDRRHRHDRRRLDGRPCRRPGRPRGRGLRRHRGRRRNGSPATVPAATARRHPARHRHARSRRLPGSRAAQSRPAAEPHPGGLPDRPHQHGRRGRRVTRRRTRLPQEAVRARRTARPGRRRHPRQTAAGPTSRPQRPAWTS